MSYLDIYYKEAIEVGWRPDGWTRPNSEQKIDGTPYEQGKRVMLKDNRLFEQGADAMLEKLRVMDSVSVMDVLFIAEG